MLNGVSSPINASAPHSRLKTSSTKVWLETSGHFSDIGKGQAASPAWIEPPEDEASWQALVIRLKDSHRRLKPALKRLNDEALLKIPAPELNCTLWELILSSGSAHEAHHGGQISYLRGLQGL